MVHLIASFRWATPHLPFSLLRRNWPHRPGKPELSTVWTSHSPPSRRCYPRLPHLGPRSLQRGGACRLSGNGPSLAKSLLTRSTAPYRWTPQSTQSPASSHTFSSMHPSRRAHRCRPHLPHPRLPLAPLTPSNIDVELELDSSIPVGASVDTLIGNTAETQPSDITNKTPRPTFPPPYVGISDISARLRTVERLSPRHTDMSICG